MEGGVKGRVGVVSQLTTSQIPNHSKLDFPPIVDLHFCEKMVMKLVTIKHSIKWCYAQQKDICFYFNPTVHKTFANAITLLLYAIQKLI
jgi:hypothetical protein